jgi:hypothetical protein
LKYELFKAQQKAKLLSNVVINYLSLKLDGLESKLLQAVVFNAYIHTCCKAICETSRSKMTLVCFNRSYKVAIKPYKPDWICSFNKKKSEYFKCQRCEVLLSIHPKLRLPVTVDKSTPSWLVMLGVLEINNKNGQLFS